MIHPDMINMIVENITTGMAIIHQGASYCLSNQFTLHDVNEISTVPIKNNRVEILFFIILPFLCIIISEPQTLYFFFMKNKCYL